MSQRVYTLLAVSAFFATSTLPDRIGRRYTMLVGQTFLMTGALVGGLAHNMGMFLDGRFLTGFGCSKWCSWWENVIDGNHLSIYVDGMWDFSISSITLVSCSLVVFGFLQVG